VTAPIETSATIALPSELGIAIARGFVPASFGPPAGEPRRGGEVAVNDASPFRRVGELRLDDCGESQVAERASSVPALVTALGENDLGSFRGVEVGQRREPVDP
jgi:hypothetical protein